MATRKFTGSTPGRARARKARFAVPMRTRCTAKAPDSPERSAATAESLRQLTGLTLRLRGIYGTAVAAELALRQQAADHDPEIADCLRAGVCNPIADQIRDLQDLTECFRRRAPEFKP